MSDTSKTDWNRVDDMTDDDIDTSDIPPLSDDFFESAKLRLPLSETKTVLVQVSPETLAWFESKGETADEHLSAALQIYAQAQQRAAIAKR